MVHVSDESHMGVWHGVCLVCDMCVVCVHVVFAFCVDCNFVISKHVQDGGEPTVAGASDIVSPGLVGPAA